MAAMEAERMRRKMLSGTPQTGTQTAAQTLDSLVEQDKASGSDRSLDMSWKGAEAYHFLLLAQRQLYDGYQQERPNPDPNPNPNPLTSTPTPTLGSTLTPIPTRTLTPNPRPALTQEAMRTALRLREYESIISIEEIYSLIALTAFYSRFYGQCSKAFIKLQARRHAPPAPAPAATRHAPATTDDRLSYPHLHPTSLRRAELHLALRGQDQGDQQARPRRLHPVRAGPLTPPLTPPCTPLHTLTHPFTRAHAVHPLTPHPLTPRHAPSPGTRRRTPVRAGSRRRARAVVPAARSGTLTAASAARTSPRASSRARPSSSRTSRRSAARASTATMRARRTREACATARCATRRCRCRAVDRRATSSCTATANDAAPAAERRAWLPVPWAGEFGCTLVFGAAWRVCGILNLGGDQCFDTCFSCTFTLACV